MQKGKEKQYKGDLIEIANQLSLVDMCQLINIFSDRITVFIGANKKVMLGADLHPECPAVPNGAIIQLNSEYSEKDNSFARAYNLQEVKA